MVRIHRFEVLGGGAMWPQCRSIIVLLALLLLAAATPARSQTTLRFGLDGENWLASNFDDSMLTRLAKLSALRGVMDGLMFGRSPLIVHDSIYLATSYEHLVTALDQFYSDYRNRQVFIVWALQVISMELQGKSATAVESQLARMRRRAAAARTNP